MSGKRDSGGNGDADADVKSVVACWTWVRTKTGSVSSFKGTEMVVGPVGTEVGDMGDEMDESGKVSVGSWGCEDGDEDLVVDVDPRGKGDLDDGMKVGSI